MDKKIENFSYTYSADKQDEIEKIRKKYIENTDAAPADKMEELRRLDLSVSKKATTASIVVGVVSSLVMGSGMSLIMTDIGTTLGISDVLLPGIIVGEVGMLGVIFAYPLYQHILKKERKKVAPKILELTDELLK